MSAVICKGFYHNVLKQNYFPEMLYQHYAHSPSATIL